MFLVQVHTGNSGPEGRKFRPPGNSGPEGAEIPVGRKFRPLHTGNSGLVQRAEVPLNPNEIATHIQITAIH